MNEINRARRKGRAFPHWAAAKPRETFDNTIHKISHLDLALLCASSNALMTV